MNAFVLYAHHAAVRPNAISCSKRCSWTGQTAISYRTSQICGHSLIPLTTRSTSDSRPVFSTTTAVFNGGGGFLGVGPSEIVVVLGVGWFLLGPKKLYSLAKDTGRLLGELRRTADEAKESLNEAIELDAITAEIEEGKKLVQEISRPLSNDVGGKTKTKDKSSDMVLTDTTSGDDQLATAEAKTISAESAPAESAPAASVPAASTSAASEPPVNNAFLEQLQRVADPNQKPPEDLPEIDVENLPDIDVGDIPDIDVDMQEELEVRKLESDYLEARERLEERRKQRTENTGAGSEAIVEER